MKKIYSLLIFLYIFFLVIFFSKNIIAQEVSQLTPDQNNIKEQLYLKDQYEFIKTQTLRAEERFNNFINNAQSEREFFYAAITLIIGIAAFLGYSSLRSFKEELKREARKTFDEHVEKNKTRLEDEIKQWTRQLVNEKMGLVKKILFIADIKDHKNLLNNEIKIIKSRFKNVSLKKPGEGIIDQYDLVIFNYNDDMNSELNDLIDQVNNKKSSLPVIGYYNANISNEKLKRYKWHTYAQSPLTLFSWVNTLLTITNNLN